MRFDSAHAPQSNVACDSGPSCRVRVVAAVGAPVVSLTQNVALAVSEVKARDKSRKETRRGMNVTREKGNREERHRQVS